MLKQPRPHYYKMIMAMMFVTLLLIVLLVCSLGIVWQIVGTEPSKAVRIRTILPTFTPTGDVVLQAAAPAEASNAPAPVEASSVPAPVETSSVPAEASLDSQAAAAATPIRRTHLPTLTPTPMANQMAGAPNQSMSMAQPTATQPVSNPSIAPTSTAPPTPTVLANPPGNPPPAPSSPNPNPTPTLPPPPDPPDPPKSAVPGWAFAGVRATIDEGNAIVFGELINNTGAPQTEVQVSGILYDRYDRIIIDGVDTLDYVPVEVVPVGARIPFELVVESDQPIYRIDLVGISAPADSSPRQDFQFSGVSQRVDPSGLYCIEGRIKNLGSPLQEHLIVLATTYDSQGQVVSFGEHAEGSPSNVSADQASPFEICIDPVGQQISNHQLKAVGL